MLVLENDADGFIQFSISVVDHVGNMLTLVHTDIFPPAYVDNTPPTLSALSITSDNPVDPKSALLNDVITITANFDSAIYDVSATIFNRVATTSISGVGDIITAKVTVNESDAGDVHFTMSVSDYVEHVATANESNLTSTNVVVTSSASLQSLNISSNSTFPGRVKTNDLINITLVIDNAIYDAHATILGRTVVPQITGNTAVFSTRIMSHDDDFYLPFVISVTDVYNSRLALTQDDLTSLNVVILNYDGPTQVFSPSIFSKIPSSDKYPLLTYSYDISIVDIGRRTYALATSVSSPHGDGLQIVDISYPKKPTPVTAIFDNSSTITNFTHLDNLFAVHTVKFGSETYALTASYTEGVEIINITDPKFPTVVPYSIYLPRNAYDITTMEINSKTYALILFGNHQMRIIDITNPASITHVSTTNDGVNSINLRNPRSIDVVTIDSNTYAITISTNSIQIMNVTVPESPVAVWHILESPNTFGFFSYLDITNIASSIFALYGQSYSLKISNITNIDDPSYETIDAVSPIYPTGIDTMTVEAFTYAVVGDSNSIRIIDITNPSWTILNSTFSDTSSTYLEYPTDVAIADIDHNMYALVSNYAGSSSGIQNSPRRVGNVNNTY